MVEKKIVRFAYRGLTNEEHAEYGGAAIGLIQKYNPATLGIANIFAECLQAYQQEMSVLDIVVKSEFTAKIVEQDAERELVFNALNNTVKAAKGHYDKTLREHAKRIEFVLDHYGNIANKTYNAETAAIDDLIRELQDTRTADINVLNLSPWIASLRRENNIFRTLMADRVTELANRPTVRMIGMRKIFDKCLRAMLDYIEIFVTMSGGSPVHEAFINEFNVVSTQYKKLVD